MTDNQKHTRVETGVANISRRSLLGIAGLAVATSVFPSAAETANRGEGSPGSSAISPVMDKLSVYMSASRDHAVPEDVAEKTKHHILDTIAAMISGSKLLPGAVALQFAEDYGGKPTATIVASKLACGPIEAALTNGMLAHADETDDSHPPSQSHPGCAVVPAALAVGERFGITGVHFLHAVVLGYDVGSRVTMTLGGQKFEAESHWSTHSIAPLFGATAAAGCAASLSAEQMRFLLGYAGHQSSGLGLWNRDTDHIQKAFHFGGMTARSGVTSALLVQAGWTGVNDIFSGKDNFFAAYNPQADPAGLVESLGERFEIVRTNIKKWPVGSPIQAALDALHLLRKQRQFEADEVDWVTVRMATDEAAIVNNREIADICLQHMVAVMLMDKTVTFRSAHEKSRMKDPATLRERAKVKLVPDDQLERLMPLRVAIVNVELKDGTHLSRRVDDVRGTPKNLMTRDEVVSKAHDLIAPILGETQAANLIEQLLNIEHVENVKELRQLLQLS